MTEDTDQPQITGTIVVQLEPYRERRRTRGRAAGFLIGYLLGAHLLPAAGDLLERWLTVDELARQNGAADRVAAYTEDE